MNKILFLIGLVCGIVGISVGTIGLVAATSDSEEEEEQYIENNFYIIDTISMKKLDGKHRLQTI